MDLLAIAVITLGVVVGKLVLRRAEERARREDVVWREVRGLADRAILAFGWPDSSG